MHPITEKVLELEAERIRLEDRIQSIIYEIHDIQRNCNHTDEKGNTTYSVVSYDGLNKVYECSICKKETRKRP